MNATTANTHTLYPKTKNNRRNNTGRQRQHGARAVSFSMVEWKMKYGKNPV